MPSVAAPRLGVDDEAPVGLADLIANNRPDPVIGNHTLDRFARGINIDERGAGPDPKLHG